VLSRLHDGHFQHLTAGLAVSHPFHPDDPFRLPR